MATATMIVPPKYEAELFGQGFLWAQISARKVTLCREHENGGNVSVYYNKFDAVEQMTFAQLVQFVLNKIKGQQ